MYHKSNNLDVCSCHDTKMVFSEMEKKQFEHEKLTCCAECSSNYEKDVQSFKSSGGLPPWMHVHGSNNSDSQKVRRIYKLKLILGLVFLF